MPAKSHRRRLKRRAKRGLNPGHGGRCSLRARMRSVTLAPTTIASQTEIPPPLREAQGDAVGAGFKPARPQGMTVQGSGERIPYPADVYPHRRAGEATAPAGRKNHGDDGGRTSRRSPEGRRSGDVGGAGLKPQMKLRTAIARDPNNAAMLRPPTRRTESSPKGRIKRAQPPSRSVRGRAQAKRVSGGCPG